MCRPGWINDCSCCEFPSAPIPLKDGQAEADENQSTGVQMIAWAALKDIDIAIDLDIVLVLGDSQLYRPTILTRHRHIDNAVCDTCGAPT
jgi:hypothetical protein